MILVTGGTGLVGAHLLYFLLQEQKRVRAIHRKNSDIESVKRVFSLYNGDVITLFNKIEWVEANITDIPALNAAFTGVTKVYHCAGFITFDPAKYHKLKKINVEGTANIVNLSLAHNVEKMCYVSSVSTLGSVVKGEFISEETPWNPDEKNSVYAIAKYGAEMEVWRGAQEGLDVVIVSPGVILGTPPTSGGSSLIVSIAAKGIPFYPSGSMGIVDVIDVVKAMMQLMHSNIKNEKFILVAANTTYKELLSSFAVLFGRKAPSLKLSKGFMYMLSGIDWGISKLFGTKRRIVKATVRSMFTHSLYDSSKIKSAIDYRYIPVSETLERIAKEKKSDLN